MTDDLVAAIDQATRSLWHTSQHNKMIIALAGRIQEEVHALREAAGLERFGWNTAFRDDEFGRCTVHVSDCEGQHTEAHARFRMSGTRTDVGPTS